MPRCVAGFFYYTCFVVNKYVLLCGFKQTKGKRYENSDSFDRIAAGIGCGVCVGDLWTLAAGGGGMRDTIDMAREAGILGEFDTAQDIIECGIEVWLSGERGIQTLERFAELIRADEREACAKVADLAEPYQAADLIRARGEIK